jgi:starvation-inducible DNA-binding protein
MDTTAAKAHRLARLTTPNRLNEDAVHEIAPSFRALLADIFALYIKTKNFHWHMYGPHFRDYHLMLDAPGEEILAVTDRLAERIRSVGGTTLRSIGQIGILQRILDNNAGFVTPEDMIAELRGDNMQLAAEMLAAHGICDQHGDLAGASLLENWIDVADQRAWFLFEATWIVGRET